MIHFLRIAAKAVRSCEPSNATHTTPTTIMNLPQETLNSIKSQYPELWREKAAAGLGDQLIAAAILSQVEQDAKNPPEEEALRRVSSANALVLAAQQRLAMMAGAAQGIYDDVRSQFPTLELDLPISLPVDGQEVAQLIAGYRGQAESDANEIRRLQGELKAAQELLAGKDNDSSGELLMKLRGCNNIKEVRDAFAAFDADNAAAE